MELKGFEFPYVPSVSFSSPEFSYLQITGSDLSLAVTINHAYQQKS